MVARALGGHFAEARRALADPSGRFGAQDPLAARFDEEQLARLLSDAGLTVQSVHGVRVFTDLVPGALVDADPQARLRPGGAGGGGRRPAGVPRGGRAAALAGAQERVLYPRGAA